jgi:hypothetical protein
MMPDHETLYQTLERIQQEWGMSNQQIAAMAHVDEQTYIRWLEEGRTAVNPPSIPFGMDNAVPIVSIYKALRRRFPDSDDRMKWLFKENSDFGGNKPIDIVASSVENLFWVSYYLESSKS